MKLIVNPTDRSSLSGKTIIVTRAAGQSGEFSLKLREAGAKVLEMPTIEIVPPSSWDELDRAIAQISQFDWLILTSTNAVSYFWQRLSHNGKNNSDLANLQIAVVGQKTAQSLHKKEIEPNFIPPNFVADSLVENFPENPAHKKILFPRVETGGREVLVKELTAKGAKVIEVPTYESRCPQTIDNSVLNALQQNQVDAITFASSKTVKNFDTLISQVNGINLKGICIASIGPQTSETCQRVFGRVDLEAQEYTLDGLLEALREFFSNFN
nr:uroporphyrinogen-III synthase [Merismopedia glauca]